MSSEFKFFFQSWVINKVASFNNVYWNVKNVREKQNLLHKATNFDGWEQNLLLTK